VRAGTDPLRGALQVMLTVRRSAMLWCRKTSRGSIAGEWFMTLGTR